MARVFSQMQNSAVTFVCDLEPEKLILARKRHPDINTTNSYLDMLGEIDACGYYLAAINALQIRKACFSKRFDVLVEKPFVLDLKEAKYPGLLTSDSKKVSSYDVLFLRRAMIGSNTKKVVTKYL